MQNHDFGIFLKCAGQNKPPRPSRGAPQLCDAGVRCPFRVFLGGPCAVVTGSSDPSGGPHRPFGVSSSSGALICTAESFLGPGHVLLSGPELSPHTDLWRVPVVYLTWGWCEAPTSELRCGDKRCHCHKLPRKRLIKALIINLVLESQVHLSSQCFISIIRDRPRNASSNRLKAHEIRKQIH